MNLLKLFCVSEIIDDFDYPTPEKPPERVHITASAGLSMQIKVILIGLILGAFLAGIMVGNAWGHDFIYSELFYHPKDGTGAIIGTNLDYLPITFHKLESDGLWHAYFISKDHRVIHLSIYGGETVRDTLKYLNSKMREIDERSKK